MKLIALTLACIVWSTGSVAGKDPMAWREQGEFKITSSPDGFPVDGDLVRARLLLWGMRFAVAGKAPSMLSKVLAAGADPRVVFYDFRDTQNPPVLFVRDPVSAGILIEHGAPLDVLVDTGDDIAPHMHILSEALGRPPMLSEKKWADNWDKHASAPGFASITSSLESEFGSMPPAVPDTARGVADRAMTADVLARAASDSMISRVHRDLGSSGNVIRVSSTLEWTVSAGYLSASMVILQRLSGLPGWAASAAVEPLSLPSEPAAVSPLARLSSLSCWIGPDDAVVLRRTLVPALLSAGADPGRKYPLRGTAGSLSAMARVMLSSGFDSVLMSSVRDILGQTLFDSFREEALAHSSLDPAAFELEYRFSEPCRPINGKVVKK